MPDPSAHGTGLPRELARRYLPLKVSVAVIAGTYVLFLVGSATVRTPNLVLTTAFMAVVLLSLSLGYRLSVAHRHNRRVAEWVISAPGKGVKVTIMLAAAWYSIFGIASLVEYGATDPFDIVAAIVSPGRAYLSKFQVLDQQASEGRVSLPLQIVVLTGALYLVLVPLTVMYWRHLSAALRGWSLFSIATYLAFFVFVGTQKGPGDVAIFLFASVAALAGVPRQGAEVAGGRKRRSGHPVVLLATASIGLLLLMAFVQGDRAAQAGIQGRYPPNPVIADVLGNRMAIGLAITLSYPTNGYEGLAQEIALPFEFSGGASMPALSSYAVQYLGVPSSKPLSFPARNEAVTGRSAGVYWSTIYPWLASDFTFPGVVILVGIFGWFLARFWIEARQDLDPLALVLFSSMMITVFYSSANNQLMLSRYTALGFLQLLLLYIFRNLARNARRESGEEPIAARPGSAHRSVAD